MRELKQITITLAFDEDDLGPQWMNQDNLALLLYSQMSTRKDLLEIVEYDTRTQPKQMVVEKDAELAVAFIISDLAGRKGLDREWEQIDSDVMDEIKTTWKMLILEVCKQDTTLTEG